jgi:uroporphyrinogen decarboxylase
MSSRERILKTLNHEEPDRVPLDLAGTTWTGITHTAYQHLREYMGLPPSAPEWSDVIQQIVIPEEKMLDDLEVDTRGVFPLTSHNDDVYGKLKDRGEYREYLDEWSFVHHFPKNGYWFSLVKSPMEAIDFSGERIIEDFAWPDAGNPRRFAGLRERAIEFRNRDKIVFTKGLCAGLFEMHQRIRGMTNAMTDHLLYPGNSDRLVGKLADLKIEFWEEALNEVGDVVDIVGEGDDYGTQWSQLIGPEQFREYYKPHFTRVLDFIRNKAPGVKLMFHSCGNVRPIIPDFIEMGVDILNPVHITAEGMEPTQLKRDFGSDIVFWGGGIDTQQVLPHGTPSEIADHVRSNLDALAPGGGYVFCTVHNIQAEVPAANMMAMYRAYTQYREY